jgi:hypothetical protein
VLSGMFQVRGVGERLKFGDIVVCSILVFKWKSIDPLGYRLDIQNIKSRNTTAGIAQVED